MSARIRLRNASRSISAIILALALTASPAAAQTLYGSLTGNLVDPSGAAVPNAKVEVRNAGTGNVKTDLTDERGARSESAVDRHSKREVALPLDGSVFRTFKIRERMGFEVRAEMFGVTNTPQFGQPGATVSNMTLNTGSSIRALSGYTEITSASGERQIRFAAKFSF